MTESTDDHLTEKRMRQFAGEAEARYLHKTQSASDRELMGASHRFLEQFSKNPFAVIKIKEHGTKPVAVSATTEAGRAVYGANNIMSDTASAGEVASKSINAETPTTPPQSEKNYTGSDGCAVTSRSPSPALRPAFSVKTVTTKKPFKFNPQAKEFVPNPDLIMTFHGLVPREQPFPLYQHQRYEPYDHVMQEGYRPYGSMVENYHYHNHSGYKNRRRGKPSAPWY